MSKFRHLPGLILLTLTALAFTCCKVNDEEELVVTAPPEYEVDLFEYRAPADGMPTFGLWIESVEKYECPGYNIDAQITVQNGSIKVNIPGVTAPTPCTGDSARARQFLPIGNLADGTYEFFFSLRNLIVNEGTLEVSNGRYILSLPDAKGIVVENFVLESLPDGMVWGYAATPDEASQPVADNFLADLKTVTAENGLAPGFYSYFTVSGTGNVTLHKSIANGGPAKPFVRLLTATPGELKGILQTYRNAAQQPLDIRCWTTEGEY
ncbi:MAG: hypothetical protein EPGJADBJ_04589 [Saprospiraceae bacterium]|nr:hypothetical protein [Saprospiraceae bacterium]